MAAHVTSGDNARKKGHTSTLLKRLNTLKCKTTECARPVGFQLRLVGSGPVANMATRAGGANGSGEDLAVEGKRRVVPLMLSVEMRRPMLLVEHADDYPEERGNNWHEKTKSWNER